MIESLTTYMGQGKLGASLEDHEPATGHPYVVILAIYGPGEGDRH